MITKDNWDTPVGRAVQWASNKFREFTTLDFLSEKAQSSLFYHAANALLDLPQEMMHPDHVINRNYTYVWSAVQKHGLGSLLSHSWATAFTSEFLEMVQENMWRSIYHDNERFDEQIERNRRIDEMQALKKASEIAKAKKILEGA